jgi:hypothetical protein
MLSPRILRTVTAKPFDPRKMRVDPQRRAELLRTRGIRAAQLLGKTTPYDLKTPWLTLRPDRPFVADKGWIEYTSPSFVGMGQFEDGQYLYAGFDLIFEKEEKSAYSIERPQLTIHLKNTPSSLILVEMDIHTYDWPAGSPKFELIAKQHQTITIAEGHRETIMFLMQDFASLQSAWADGPDFKDKDGNWAFFEARMTPID